MPNGHRQALLLLRYGAELQLTTRGHLLPVARRLPTTSYCSSSSYRPILDRYLCPVAKLLRALRCEGQSADFHVEWATQVADTVGSDIGHRLPARIPTHLVLTVDCSSITKAGGLSS
jgi:hypothetical protein